MEDAGTVADPLNGGAPGARCGTADVQNILRDGARAWCGDNRLRRRKLSEAVFMLTP
jgi:hypothetical protein